MAELPELIGEHRESRALLSEEPLVAAVDVGTGSARAGVFTKGGRLLGSGEHPIALQSPTANHAEHDSEDIWRAVCTALRAAVAAADADPASVKGLSFDATCSLVMRDTAGAPLSVSLSGEARWDTIVWLDHRAMREADECTATGHPLLNAAGGVMSPEMQSPKLMWLKRHRAESWAKAGFLFDLVDFLTWRATGRTERSQCTLACKWPYMAREERWPADFLDEVGLSDLTMRAGLPARASPVGTRLGTLTSNAAAELGLAENCIVGVGLIDAYAGALGVLGGYADQPEILDRQLALIAGTSSCVMAISPVERAFPEGWGPYPDAALPGFWVAEGGQSATGALLDHIVRLHGGGAQPDRATHARICTRIAELRAESGGDLAPRLHVLPDFHGNRSPLVDPRALGVISGLALDASFDALCRLYWRTAVAIALGVRHILDTLAIRGYAIDTLHVTGGHTRNPLLIELYADATGCTAVEPDGEDFAVLLGTAMVAAAAAGLYADLRQAGVGMRQPGRSHPPDPKKKPLYERDYRIFLEMQRQRTVLDELGAASP